MIKNNVGCFVHYIWLVSKNYYKISVVSRNCITINLYLQCHVYNRVIESGLAFHELLFEISEGDLVIACGVGSTAFSQIQKRLQVSWCLPAFVSMASSSFRLRSSFCVFRTNIFDIIVVVVYIIVSIFPTLFCYYYHCDFIFCY